MSRKIVAMCVGICVAAFALYAAARVRAKERGGQHRWPRITERIDDHDRVILRGNTRPEANRKNDRGRVSDGVAMEHMLMLLKRSPEQEADLQSFLTAVQDKTSPSYHQWITPAQFGTQFGVDPSDIATVSGWLEQHGFTVNFAYDSGMMIDFSGTAGDVARAFHTEIHHIEARGATHIANMSDPQVPKALEPVVAGIIALNDIPPRPMLKPKVNPAYTISPPGNIAVVPPDVATIYGLNPLFALGITGVGQTIAVVEDTNLFTTADWTTFRSTFGLAGYGGTLATVHPAPNHGTSCGSPGVNGDDGEAILDASYALAAAPSAAIVVASCPSVFTAIENEVEAATPPNIISISYGECEALNTAAGNAALDNAYATGVAAGISIFVSSGDEGAASCDADQLQAEHGIGVSGWTSSTHVVSVGGTDFADAYLGTTGTYWNTANTSTFGSAKSYIPEIPWNDSCASVLLATIHGSTTVTYGTSGFCNSTTGEANYITTASGSGGPSGCATGTAPGGGVVGGTCAGYAKPSWQIGLFGNPSDGVRDIPDVSLFAANGSWGHYYIVCYSDNTHGRPGVPCTGSPAGWAGFGGTSISSPIMAGIQALVDEVHGKQGNPNTVYYTIANQEFGTTGTTICNSSNLPLMTPGTMAACVFNDVTLGDMDVNCLAYTATGGDGLLHNCYLPSGTNGVLSTDNNNYVPAFTATPGWDFATGIGSVNAFFLVLNPNW